MSKKKDRKSKRLKRRERQGKEVFYNSSNIVRGKRSRAYAKIKRTRVAETYDNPVKHKKKDRGTKRRKKRVKKKILDYDKVFYMPNGKGFQVAYRDLQCESTLEDILSRFRSKSVKTLYNRIVELLNMEETYDADLQKETNGRMGSSSGMAGKCAFSCGNIIALQDDIDLLKNKNNITRHKSQENKRKGKKPLWYHQGQYDYWQNITQDGSFFITHFTPKQLLIIACGIMSYVVETERRYFYESLYHDLCVYIPELKDYLPRP